MQPSRYYRGWQRLDTLLLRIKADDGTPITFETYIGTILVHFYSSAAR